MNPVDRPLLDIGLTRLEFLRISGKGLAGLTIAPALLSLLGCKQEDIDSGTVGLINTPKGVLVTQRARCTGCHRCEISCTNFNDGSVGTFFSRIKIHRNYFFGDNGVRSIPIRRSFCCAMISTGSCQCCRPREKQNPFISAHWAAIEPTRYVCKSSTSWDGPGRKQRKSGHPSGYSPKPVALAAACMAISTIPRTLAVNAKSRNA